MIYTELEKRIYISPIGTHHDPVEVTHRLIVHSQGKFNEWFAARYDPTNDAVALASVALAIVPVARSAFGFKSLTADSGVGDGAVLEVIDHFMEYTAKKG